MKCAAIITAAGLSSRMNRFKPLMPLIDSTVINETIKKYRASGVEDIVVVTGRNRELIESHVSGLGVHCVYNSSYAETEMFDSIKLGLNALCPNYDCVLITPVDIPMVKQETLQALIESGESSARPVFNGVNGHPLFLSSHLVPRIIDFTGDGGLKGALQFIGENVVSVPVEDAGCTLDADDPGEYLRLLYLDAGRHRLPAQFAEQVFLSLFPDYYISEKLILTYCEGLFDAFSVPEHIRRHSRAVALKADEIAAGIPGTNRYGLQAASMMHDLVRLEDHHAEKAAEIARSLKFSVLADWISSHHNLRPEDINSSYEPAILYYADKLIKEDQEVSLDTRFNESLKKCKTEEAIQNHARRYSDAKKIEEILRRVSI